MDGVFVDLRLPSNNSLLSLSQQFSNNSHILTAVKTHSKRLGILDGNLDLD